jgi:hypothetical protein
MPTTCVCFRPDCAANGCVKDAKATQFNPMRGSVLLCYWRDWHVAPKDTESKPLTEADIRRIVREEIANAMSSGVKP